MVEAAHVVVRRLLRAEWNVANTHSIAPAFTLGWVTEDTAYPAVTVTDPDESPMNGGNTGFSGTDSGGGGPTQTIGGSVNVHCWVNRDRTGTPSAQQLAYAMREEVRRIIGNHFEPPATTGLAVLSYMGSQQLVDPEANTVRYTVRIGYGYYSHPVGAA